MYEKTNIEYSSPKEIDLVNAEAFKINNLTNDCLTEKDDLRKNIRALRILSLCNRTLTRAKEEKSLLKDICRIIINSGGYKFVWIGYFQNNNENSFNPASYAGKFNEFPDAVKIFTSIINSNESIISKVKCENSPQIIQDISTLDTDLAGRRLAIKNGISSVIIFPLLKDNACFGSLNIYSDKKNIFDEGEINLLTELSDDIAFGISSLRTLAEKEKIATNLKISEERTRSLFENAPIGIFRTSIDGKVFAANPEIVKILGYNSFKELKKVRLQDIYVKKDERKKFLELALSQKIVIGFETEFRRKDDSIITVSITGRLIKNDISNKQYIEGTLEDITFKKEIEKQIIAAKEKAEEMNRLKDNFLAVMSHELRTPMVGILGFSEIFLNILEETEHKEMAEALYSSGKRLMETLDSILDLTKLEANKVKLNKKNTNINEIAEKVISYFEKIASQRNLYLKYKINDNQLYSFLDVDILKKILHNLISNAIKYTVYGGVTIEVGSIYKDKKKWAEIKVIDTGIGIPKKNRELIFEDFRQLSEGLNRKYEGTGLGLSLTKRFVELLGGKIKFKSVINSGTTFSICFPVLDSTNKSIAGKK